VIRPAALAVLLVWVGATLLFGQFRWFRRPRLTDRIGPYTPGATIGTSGAGLLSVTSLREVTGPLARTVGDDLSRLFGVSDDLALRLERAHSPLTVTAFRSRQLGASLMTFGLGGLLGLALAAPPMVTLLLLLGSPLLTFLLLEQHAQRAARAWQRRLFLELPVVTEQLGMLLGAGYSLGAGLSRLAQRGRGACATDLTRVSARIRQGLSDIEALQEWSRTADVDALTRLVSILALNREGGDLSRLIAEEARTIRRDAHRELIETIQRRGQQVWIPVTVATLVPGVLFIVVPFIDAMRMFTTG
jgi:tight adherence protein C